jgi:tetratricopeptide (TPR) repeat protein
MNAENTGGPSMTPPEQPESSKGIGPAWKIGLGIAAVVVIGILLFPLIQRPQTEATESAYEVNSPVGPSATPAEISAAPQTAEGQFELANTLYESGKLDAAVQAYQAAIQLNPNYQAAYANLGVVYYQQQKFDLAATQYKKSLELDPDDGDVAYNLGVLYLQQALSTNEQPDAQLLTKAVTQLQAARELSPDLAEPYFSLGVAYLVSEERAKAIESFETFLSFELDIDPRARQEAERYLTLLKDSPQ